MICQVVVVVVVPWQKSAHLLFLKIIFLLNNPGKRENLIKNIPSLIHRFYTVQVVYGGFPSGGTTPEVQRTLRGGPCGTLRCGRGTNPRRVCPRGYRFQRPPAERCEAVPPSEARLKRGSTEAPPSEARPREGHREVAITKLKLKKVPPESPGEPLIFSFWWNHTGQKSREL